MRAAPIASDHGQPITAACNPRRSKRVQNGRERPAGSGVEIRVTGGINPHALEPMPPGMIRKRSPARLSGVKYPRRPVTPWRKGSLPVATDAQIDFGLIVGN